MKPKITFVVDEPALRKVTVAVDAVDRIMHSWRVHELAKSIVAAGADVQVFRGGLEGAPESWAYILLNEWIEGVAAHPGVRARFPRTIGLISIREACRDADRFGLAGSIDERGASDPLNRAPGRLNFICVKRSVAAELGWDLDPINSSTNYAAIDGLPHSSGQLTLTYLRALLGDPAEASPPSPPAP